MIYSNNGKSRPAASGVQVISELSEISLFSKRFTQKHKNGLSWGLGLPGGSDSKKSASSVGDLALIPRSGRSLGKGMATHSSILPRESCGQRSLVGCSPWGRKELDTTEAT